MFFIVSVSLKIKQIPVSIHMDQSPAFQIILLHFDKT